MSTARLIIVASPPRGETATLTFDMTESIDLHQMLYRLWTREAPPELMALLESTGHATGRPIPGPPGASFVTGGDSDSQERTIRPKALPEIEETQMVSTLLDLGQVAGHFGCSPRTVRRLVEEGKLATVKVLSKRRVTAAEVNRYIRDNEGHHTHGQ